MDRLTEVVDVGAYPIDGDPPYKSMLAAGLCRVTGFEPQEDALARLNAKKGPTDRYLPYAIGDGERHRLRICRAPGMTSLLEPDPTMPRSLTYCGHSVPSFGRSTWRRAISTVSMKFAVSTS
jgi:hypothetical protein